MMLWEILVPTIMEESPVRTRHHKEWDKYVRRIANGLTVLRPAKGQWMDPESKSLIAERMIPVRIICTKEQILRIANFTKVHYKQKAVLAYLLSSDVLMV